MCPASKYIYICIYPTSIYLLQDGRTALDHEHLLAALAADADVECIVLKGVKDKILVVWRHGQCAALLVVAALQVYPLWFCHTREGMRLRSKSTRYCELWSMPRHHEQACSVLVTGVAANDAPRAQLGALAA